MKQTIDLNGEWNLRWHDDERGDRAQRLCDGTAALECAWQVFECLDLAAIVYLNGMAVGRHANSFYPLRVEVTGTLKAGDNTVVVQLDSGLFHAAHRSSSEYLYNCNLTKRPWLRKVQSEHGWDWSPRLLNVGIHGPVQLEIHRDVRWQDCSIVAEVDDALTTGQVRARVFVEGLDKKAVRKKLTLRVGKVEQTASVTVKPGMNCLEVSLTVAKPKLWWPVGHGRQPRYEVEVKLEGVGADRKKVGFRHVRVRQQNGKAVFDSDTFAWRVCLDLDGERALPDNFFDVYPGIPTVLDWPEQLGKPCVIRVGNSGTEKDVSRQ